MSPALTSPDTLPTNLKGKTVLVIGGSAGWGAATARAAARLGANVVAVSRSGDAPAGLNDALAITTAAVDFTDEASLRTLAQSLPVIDHVLVTAASIGGGPVTSTSFSDVEETIVGWLKGSYLVGHVFGAAIAPGGSLTFSSGVSAFKPQPGTGAPAAAAAGIEALTRVLALELAPVRVNAIRPGGVDTDLFRRLIGGGGDEAVAAIGSSLPLGRVAHVDDLASAAVFLMSSPYVSGVVLPVDGAASLA